MTPADKGITQARYDVQNVKDIYNKAVEISSWARWDGELILEVMLEALTDANWHTEVSEIRDYLQTRNK